MNSQTPILDPTNPRLPVTFSMDGEDLEAAIRGLLAARHNFERAAIILETLSDQLHPRLEEIQIVNLDLAAYAFRSIAQTEGEALHRLGKIIDLASGFPE